MDAKLILSGFADLNHAAADLRAERREQLDRPRLYRVLTIPARQPADVIMCHRLSAWLCQYYERKEHHGSNLR